MKVITANDTMFLHGDMTTILRFLRELRNLTASSNDMKLEVLLKEVIKQIHKETKALMPKAYQTAYTIKCSSSKLNDFSEFILSKVAENNKLVHGEYDEECDLDVVLSSTTGSIYWKNIDDPNEYFIRF